MLVGREPVTFAKGLTPVRKNWRALLRDNEQSFLTDNQLSVFVDRKKPGCERTHFYPLPFPHRFAHRRWDYTELGDHDCLRSSGPLLDFEPDKTRLLFQPHGIEKKMRSTAGGIVERSAVVGNTLLLEWEITGLEAVVLRFSLPHFGASAEGIRNGILASVRNKAFAALCISGAREVSFETEEEPFECRSNIGIAPGEKIYLALSYGYDRQSPVAWARSGLRNPQKVFRQAERTWEDYFAKVVPHFSCSDKRLERLYYYQAYVTRTSLYDIPYEPFTHHYTAPWKTGAVWQWSWNTPMNSISERWLNDKTVGAGGILLEGTCGGSLNLGTYLHPTTKQTKLRGHNEHAETIGRYLKELPPEYDIIACTNLPHTTPNGLLGAWEFYLCCGDKEFLKKALDVMAEAESQFSKHELENGLYACTFVDEFDYSLRWKPFIKAFAKGDPTMMLKMDTPFIAIDYNCYLHALREKTIQAAAVTAASDIDTAVLREKNERLRASINQHLWDEADGFYYDVDPRNMRRSGVKSIAGIAAPLYSGIASHHQAARLVGHLTNPSEFGTPYPCPSVSMDTPDLDPSVITYGGDSLITSGVWFTVEGLVRYGYNELAAQYVLRTLEMLTRDGPSSSYSYHSVTGKHNQDKHTLATQSCIFTDLICRYLIGLCPGDGGELSIKPVALAPSGIKSFVFGPYNYCGRSVTVRFSRTKGYRVSIVGGDAT